MSDESYNGWRNYPTWAVHMWITNEPGPYDYALEIATDAANKAHIRYEVAGALKDWIREENEPDDASMASDLLGYAFDSVDWYEIADAMIEAAKELQEA